MKTSFQGNLANLQRPLSTGDITRRDFLIGAEGLLALDDPGEFLLGGEAS